jgi:hypothetical protein
MTKLKTSLEQIHSYAKLQFYRKVLINEVCHLRVDKSSGAVVHVQGRLGPTFFEVA